MARRLALLLALGASAAATAAWGQSVALNGILGGKALLIVDGNPPKVVAPGDAFRGVKVVSTTSDSALLDIAGKQHTLRVGDTPSNVGNIAGGEGGSRLVLTAGTGGHFVTQGQINGKTLTMVVDTGATSVTLGSADAQRIGLDFRKGQMVQMSTANGVAPGWRVKIDALRINDVVVYNVDAVVASGTLPVVLLGNSFLSHFQMTRSNDQMVLDKRF